MKIVTKAAIESSPELHLILVRAPDDPPLVSPEFQKELFEFAQSLRGQDIQVENRWYAFDSAQGGGGDHFRLAFIAF
jgi:hypothetical protein